jgi:ABC-type Mn2+/Zn2+ transport system permease subunit
VPLADVLTTVLDPWREPIMRNALLEMSLVGISCGVLGVWIVLHGAAYGAESLPHGMLPGLVLAALLGAPLVLGGAAGLLVAAAAIALAARVRGIGADNAVAVVVTGLFGLGALLALSPATPAGLGELLFGDVLGADAGDVAVAAGLSALLLAGAWLFHWRLLAVGFDPVGARALGLSPLVAGLALGGLLALAVLIGVQGLGNLLVVAALVAPAAAARRLTARIGSMMALAAAIAVAAGIAGLYLSYYADVAAGASIAGMMLLAYALAPAVASLRRVAAR